MQADLGLKHWAVCHCSAGVGRTGTFIALLWVLRHLSSVSDEVALDAAVTGVIESMRERRLWMVKTDIEYATLYAAVLLRLRNPEPADFALTWPLKDGARTLPPENQRGEASAAVPRPLAASVPSASAGVVPPSPRARGGGGFGGLSGGGAAAAAAAAPTPSPPPPNDDASLAADAPLAEAAAMSAAPGGSGSSARAGRKPSGAGASSGRGSGLAPHAAADGAVSEATTALRVRTPEDDEEAAMEVEGALSDGGGAQAAERVDNTADIARYAGIGVPRP